MNSKTNSTDLYLVSFQNSCIVYTDEAMRDLEKPLLASDNNQVQSVRKVKPLSEQRSELDSLTFELKMNSQILESLVQKLYDLKDDSKEYVDALENISFFVHHNIIDLTTEKIADLNSVLEYKGIVH